MIVILGLTVILGKNETGTCDMISGECIHACILGYAGPNCSVKCPENCGTSNRGVDVCNASNEECLFGCKDGFYGSNCSERCSDVLRNCDKCEARYDNTGLECQRCSMNFYLSTGICIVCSYFCLVNATSIEPTCRHGDGYCNHGCRSGRYGFMCGERCSVTCKDVCHRDTGRCSDCKYSSYCGPTCEEPCQNGCLLMQCNQSCQCVQGCTVNNWGEKCPNLCNNNCIKRAESTKRMCDETDGTCKFGCSGERYWGNQCNKSCSSSCVNGTCDQYTGNCTDGCTSNTVYGWRCDTKCNENCRDGTCRITDGYCDKGCINGAYGIKCDTSCNTNCLGGTCERQDGYCYDCIVGMYGMKCDRYCSYNCEGNACNRQSGFCNNGCKDGYYGNFCQLTCSATCLNKTCDMVDGSCRVKIISTDEEKKFQRGTERVDGLLLGLAVSGWSLFAILLTVVIVNIVTRRTFLGCCDDKKNSGLETHPQITNQQVYTTLQHEQDDATKYEMLELGN